MIPDPGARRIAAFIVVTLFLVVGSDYEATAQLSAAFAFLILLVALMTVGPVAFGKLSCLFSSVPTTTAKG